jgi:tetratricopeptide (TPR) repeat protein
MTDPTLSSASNEPSVAPALSALAALEGEATSLAARLATVGDPAARAAVKDEIVSLFRKVESAGREVERLREVVKGLAGQWKGADAGSARTGHSARVDHLGASTFIEKGWSRIAVGDGAAALPALTRALELVPGDPAAESLLGWAYLLTGDLPRALLHLHHVLLRDPQHALARAHVGYACLLVHAWGEAIEHLSRAIRLDNDPRATLYAHLYLGLVYLDREMYTDAQLFFRKALTLGPNLLQAYYELGRAHWFAGEREAARTAWREGATANTFNPWGKRCAEQLAAVDRGESPPRVVLGG